VGGIFMTVTGLEPTKTPGTVWANSWFDLGFAFVILGLVATGVGVVLHFRKEVQPTSAPPAVDSAEWIATCDESGGENNTLVFNLRHRFNPAEILNFGELRCTVTDPDQIETTATNRAQPYLYIDSYFPGAPPVRPGLYRFRWQGRNSKGAWVDITSGEHEVKAPPKTGLEVVIDDEKLTPFPGMALIMEIEFHVTNHDPVPHSLIRRAIRGISHNPLPSTNAPEYGPVLQMYGMIRERRRADLLPNRVGAGRTVHGVFIEMYGWDPSSRLPDYTVIIGDGRHIYTARPHGAGEDPLAAWPIS
jgi:hypothetical protein